MTSKRRTNKLLLLRRFRVRSFVRWFARSLVRRLLDLGLHLAVLFAEREHCPGDRVAVVDGQSVGLGRRRWLNRLHFRDLHRFSFLWDVRNTSQATKRSFTASLLKDFAVFIVAIDAA